MLGLLVLALKRVALLGDKFLDMRLVERPGKVER